jgi:hypothetical protein
MSEFPNEVFSDGMEYTAELAYKAFYSPVFDGQTQYLGHREPIRDDELSPTGIRAEVNNLVNGLKCSKQATGLTVSYTAGQVLLPNGTVITKAAGAVLVPDNATSWVFVNQAGDVVASTTRSVSRVTLAQVTSVGGVITNLQDYRYPSILAVRQPAFVLRSFGGQSSTPKVCTQGETLRGIIECSTFTIPAGITVTVDKFCKVVASERVDIYGTVNVTQQAQGASSQWYALTPGFNFGGLVQGQGLGARGGAYHYTQQSFGSGGGTGNIANRPGNASNSAGQLRKAGDGGGSFIVEAAGNITVYSSAVITARGEDGLVPQSNDGAQTYICWASGSGGGSGGCVVLVSAGSCVIQTGATVDIRGGNGSAPYSNMPGHTNQSMVIGGNGGSAGYLVTIGVNGVNTTGFTFLNAGGTWGTAIGLNGGITAQTATKVTVSANLVNAIFQGGLGGGFAGAGSTYTFIGNDITLVPAGEGIHVIGTNLPS